MSIGITVFIFGERVADRALSTGFDVKKVQFSKTLIHLRSRTSPCKFRGEKLKQFFLRGIDEEVLAG